MNQQLKNTFAITIAQAAFGSLPTAAEQNIECDVALITDNVEANRSSSSFRSSSGFSSSIRSSAPSARRSRVGSYSSSGSSGYYSSGFRSSAPVRRTSSSPNRSTSYVKRVVIMRTAGTNTPATIPSFLGVPNRFGLQQQFAASSQLATVQQNGFPAFQPAAFPGIQAMTAMQQPGLIAVQQAAPAPLPQQEGVVSPQAGVFAAAMQSGETAAATAPETCAPTPQLVPQAAPLCVQLPQQQPMEICQPAPVQFLPQQMQTQQINFCAPQPMVQQTPLCTMAPEQNGLVGLYFEKKVRKTSAPSRRSSFRRLPSLKPSRSSYSSGGSYSRTSGSSAGSYSVYNASGSAGSSGSVSAGSYSYSA